MAMSRRDFSNRLTLIYTLSFFVLSIQVRSVVSCTADQFECSNTNCISTTKRCDNSFDCADNSDEVNCTTSDVCVESQVRCPDGSCAAALDECPMSTEPSDDTTEQEYLTTESQNVDNQPKIDDDTNENVTSGGKIFGYLLLAVFILYALSCVILIVFLIAGKEELLNKLNFLQHFERFFKYKVEPQKDKTEDHDKQDNSNTDPIPNGNNIPPNNTKKTWAIG